jgi:hypothetical protein
MILTATKTTTLIQLEEREDGQQEEETRFHTIHAGCDLIVSIYALDISISVLSPLQIKNDNFFSEVITTEQC